MAAIAAILAVKLRAAGDGSVNAATNCPCCRPGRSPPAFGVYWWLTAPVGRAADRTAAYTPNLANGQTTFNAGGCSSCHAVPGQPDRTEARRRACDTLAVRDVLRAQYLARSGRRHRALDRGRIRQRGDARAFRRRACIIFRPFPIRPTQHARVADIRDLFAYLKTLAPVPGKVRDHDVPFPFNIRRNIGIWKLLFMDGKPFTPDAARSAQWNRGAYLVNSLGHCAECHSPRNFLGGIVAAQRFAGGPNPEGEGWVPNITQKGLGDWSEKDIAYFLETGQMPDGDSAGGSMVRVIKNTFAAPRGRSRRDRRICQVAAAGRRTAAAEQDHRGQRQVLIAWGACHRARIRATRRLAMSFRGDAPSC